LDVTVDNTNIRFPGMYVGILLVIAHPYAANSPDSIAVRSSVQTEYALRHLSRVLSGRIIFDAINSGRLIMNDSTACINVEEHPIAKYNASRGSQEPRTDDFSGLAVANHHGDARGDLLVSLLLRCMG